MLVPGELQVLLAIFDGINRLSSKGGIVKKAIDEQTLLTDEEWDAIDGEIDQFVGDCKDAIRRAKIRQASSTA